jgi:hypothetical protein
VQIYEKTAIMQPTSPTFVFSLVKFFFIPYALALGISSTKMARLNYANESILAIYICCRQ